jgi:hypothetical protein
MPNRFYEAGRTFEYRVLKDLTKRGYVCRRTPASKGPYDIHALNDDHSLFVQVKSGKKGLTHAEWNTLFEQTEPWATFLPVIADRDGRRIRYRLITGYHQHGSRNWPADEYQP